MIGGGVNGCGIGRDAAGRGWSLFIGEKEYLASTRGIVVPADPKEG